MCISTCIQITIISVSFSITVASYFQAFDGQTFGRSHCHPGFGFPHPFNYKMIMVVFKMNRYQKRGGLHKISEQVFGIAFSLMYVKDGFQMIENMFFFCRILFRMQVQILQPTRTSNCELNPDIFEYLLNGVFTTVVSSLQQQEPEIHVKSQLIGKIVSQLAKVCSEYTRFVRDEATEASLLQKLRKLDNLAKVHCCPSCYPVHCCEYYFIKYVLHQEDTAPFQFYRKHNNQLYKICYDNDPNNVSFNFDKPEKCNWIHGDVWV